MKKVFMIIIGALCLWQSCILGQWSCMEKSHHGYLCNYNGDCPCGPDRKHFYPCANCPCQCWRFDKHCKCLDCGHYSRPKDFRMINKKDFYGHQNTTVQPGDAA